MEGTSTAHKTTDLYDADALDQDLVTIPTEDGASSTPQTDESKTKPLPASGDAASTAPAATHKFAVNVSSNTDASAPPTESNIEDTILALENTVMELQKLSSV